MGDFGPASTWHLHNTNPQGRRKHGPFGNPGDRRSWATGTATAPTTIGVYRPRESTFYLRNSNTPGLADIVVPFGQAGDIPDRGRLGRQRHDDDRRVPSEHQHVLPAKLQHRRLRDSVFQLGNPNDVPLAGDWDGNGTTTIGVFRPSTNAFYLTNDNSTVAASFPFGDPNDKPIVGNWDGQ